MSWFEKILPKIVTNQGDSRSAGVPKGLWKKCPECMVIHYESELQKNLYVCSSCQHHMPIPPRLRLSQLYDTDSYEELFANFQSVDPLKFKDLKKYKDRIADAKKKTQENEAVIAIVGKMDGMKVYTLVLNFDFMGGSMGSAVGAKFIQTARLAIDNRHPLVVFATSGGARMQESLFSLFQMASTSGAVEEIKRHKIPYISVLTDPTYGGVTASFAMLGDLILAEPKARIGFAGPRVIKQTVRENLPEGFQCSEFLQEHGFVDLIVHRKKMRNQLVDMLKMFTYY